MHPDDAPERADYAAKEVRSSKLPLSHQEKALAELHETITYLTERLKPVLTPAQAEPARDGLDKAPTTIQSPLADQLDANNSGVRKATSKLNALIERIEC